MDLSIIIPTLNRASSLKITLQSILLQHDNGYDFEVIVIDNGSSDHTKEVCREAGERIANFTYCYDNEPGMLTGRHRGAEIARGNILSFIDDDVELNQRWVQAIIKTFADDPHVSIVTGPCLPRYQVYPPSWVAWFWQPTPYGGTMCLPLSLIDLQTDKTWIDPLYAFGLNYSIRKNIFKELGGFHPDRIADKLQKYQGDGETGLSIKAKIRNCTALYVSSALLYHLVLQERLQVSYFEKWHYYSGICNSFTDIRSQYNLYLSYGSPPLKPRNRLLILLAKMKNMIKRIKRNKHPVPGYISELQTCFNNKFTEGYNFHQQSFKTDEKVKTWVLQPDYWNYKIPVE